jgi:hypothetical protein
MKRLTSIAAAALVAGLLRGCASDPTATAGYGADAQASRWHRRVCKPRQTW